MFIETHNSTIQDKDDIKLAFIKSVNVQAYPCGRRRSDFIQYDTDGDGATGDSEGYRIPFDPEARLNTEANNRKHSGLNGFTQTYLVDWDKTNKVLSMSLAGYLFNITLDDKYIATTRGEYTFNVNNFGSDLAGSANLNAPTATKIYANILIEDVHLFSSDFKEYYTGILRDQSTAGRPLTSIDIITEAALTDETIDYKSLSKAENCYFSGLSFSTVPLTGDTENTNSRLSLTVTNRENMPNGTTEQLVVSLCILERTDVESDWQIHQPALLPKIEHGAIEGAIVVPGEAFFRSKVTAEQDIVAQSDIEVTGNVTVNNQINTKTLVADDTITATEDLGNSLNLDVRKAHIDDLAADDLTTEELVAEKVTITKELYVQKEKQEDTAAVAKIDNANIAEVTVTEKTIITGTVTVTNDSVDEATVTNATVDNTLLVAKALNVTNKSKNAKITADNAAVDNELLVATVLNVTNDTRNAQFNVDNIKVDGTFTATSDLKDTQNKPVNNITVKRAYAETITADTANIGTTNVTTVNGDDIQQKIGENYCDVPVMFIKKDGDKYQLQLSRVNKVGF